MNNLAGLGRLYAPDKRDKKFALAKPRAAGIESRYWITRGHLDQGSTSQCVAYSGVRYLTTNPIVNKPLDPGELYLDCQRNDEWPGEDYDGTSVRALFRVLKQRGYIGEYRWAWDCETVIAHVLAVGPVVMGTEFPYTMAWPDKKGFVDASGRFDGSGHAWVIIGASRAKSAVRWINSWGPGFGQNGRAWLKFEDLDKLIRADGEACVATEIRVKT